MPVPPDLETILSTVHHSGTTLEYHLVNTWKILSGWGCPEPIRAAGLLHSAYGVLLEPNDGSRALLRSKVGPEVEDIIFHVCTIPAEPVHRGARAGLALTVRGIDGLEHRIDQPLAGAIVAIDVASTLEQLLRFDIEPAQMDRQRALFAQSLHLLPPPGRAAVARVWRLKGAGYADATPGLC